VVKLDLFGNDLSLDGSIVIGIGGTLNCWSISDISLSVSSHNLSVDGNRDVIITIPRVDLP